jgi:hypothetical protein
MILNAYAILDAFLTLLRLLLAGLVIALGFSAWRGWRRAANSEARGAVEDRGYLLLLLAVVLLFVNLASWPLFYLLLDSYVPEWPGVMCIYGVTQIGKGSQGASRFLPGLLVTLQLLKPALVFASGAWAMLYLVNRRSAHAPLMSRLLLVLIGVGLLAGVDAVVEAAYLVIPKKEEFLSAGCCTAALDGVTDRFLPSAILGENARAWLWTAYYTVNACMIVGLFAAVRGWGANPSPLGPLPERGEQQARRASEGRGGSSLSPPLRLGEGVGGRGSSAPGGRGSSLALLLAGAVLALLVSAVFLIDVAAPSLLRLPHHHCPYDLLPRAPESILAIVSFVAGTFAVGWACVTAWFADSPETRPFLGEQVRKLLVVGLFGYLGSAVMLAVEMALV